MTNWFELKIIQLFEIHNSVWPVLWPILKPVIEHNGQPNCDIYESLQCDPQKHHSEPGFWSDYWSVVLKRHRLYRSLVFSSGLNFNVVLSNVNFHKQRKRTLMHFHWKRTGTSRHLAEVAFIENRNNYFLEVQNRLCEILPESCIT